MKISVSIHDASDPVDEVDVILLLESITYRAVDLAFLSPFELLKKPKTTRNVRDD